MLILLNRQLCDIPGAFFSFFFLFSTAFVCLPLHEIEVGSETPQASSSDRSDFSLSLSRMYMKKGNHCKTVFLGVVHMLSTFEIFVSKSSLCTHSATVGDHCIRMHEVGRLLIWLRHMYIAQRVSVDERLRSQLLPFVERK